MNPNEETPGAVTTAPPEVQIQTRPDGQPDGPPPWKDGDPLRQDGPTLEEYVARGYAASGYPPMGYAARTSATPPSQNGQPTHLFFKKVLNDMKFFVDLKPVIFEPLDRNFGVLKISADDPFVPALADSAKAKRGGIVIIDEQTYHDLKKKLPFKPLVPRSQQHVLQVLQTSVPRKPKPPAGAVAGGVETISDGTGVGPVGGGGTGDGAGTPAPAPVPPAPPGEFKPATAKKSFKQPVLRKPSGNSLSGGVPEK